MMTKERRSTKPVSGKTPVSGVPASQRVTCPPCTSCRSENTVFTSAPKSDSEFRIRYCKCRRCGWTWSDVTRQPWAK